MTYDLDRFLSAQEQTYDIALAEIRADRKQSHWIWYIFPQLRGLGHSAYSDFYGIKNAEKARQYLNHAVLGCRLREISGALLDLRENDPVRVMGVPDNLKLRSCMTLFECVAEPDSVFGKVLEKFYSGNRDRRTLERLYIK